MSVPLSTCIRRLQKEFSDLQKAGLKTFRNIELIEGNLLQWQGLLIPDSAPYSKGAFRIQIDFSAEYPFKPPKITFLTEIYHPNISQDGQLCLPIMDEWKASITTEGVIDILIALVNKPAPDHPLRPELAEEYTKDQKKFMKNAEEFTKKHAESRPE